MNADRLLAHYEKIADAPDALPRLRRFILDLAVRGKLVPQDAKDEPASELLKRIAKEKARLVKEGGFNSLEESVEPSKAEPFAIPSSWAWCLLDDIAGIARGGSPRPIKSFLTEDPQGIPWIKIGDSTRGTIYIDTTEERIKPEGLSRSRLVVPGDLLLSNSMSFGYPYITNISGCIHDGWLVIRTPENQISKLYVHSMFLSEYAKQAFSLAAAGAVVQNLNAEKVRRLQVPLPPLAEQHRIVAKVDELMGLCDRLEAARAGREALRDRLALASLARLNAPDPETFQNDARFALHTLPALTTRPDQIKALRQTILNLAVRGKLVPQDANDEPASELLKLLKKARAALEAEGKIRKDKGEPPSHYGGEQGFDLPGSWSWARLNEIGQTQTGTSPSSANADLFGNFIPFIKPADLDGNQINYDGPGLSEIGISHSRLAAENSILMVCIGATLGKVNTAARPVCFNQQINSLTPFLEGLTAFIAMALKASDFQSLAWSKAGTGTLPIISKGKWEVLPIPLPPLAEQHRIVAKVDALIALCDRLEASLSATAATRRRLLDALLAEALAPVDIAEMEAAE
ncbi:MAG: restriction endonuclease subunit S [Methylobacterium sp.]|nr:restriction endonuclease subunit S [Methylobacterium sp.]